MFSIAILGLIVWSQAFSYKNAGMGLLSCEGWVINFTVGWEDFSLLNTFYSSDVINMVQSAGNFSSMYFLLLVKGSSETIRGGSFDLFRKAYEKFYNKNFEGSEDWLL